VTLRTAHGLFNPRRSSSRRILSITLLRASGKALIGWVHTDLDRNSLPDLAAHDLIHGPMLAIRIVR
jgi:hypothetical protein